MKQILRLHLDNSFLRLETSLFFNGGNKIKPHKKFKCSCCSNLTSCSIKHHIMKTYWGMDVWLHAFLTSKWSASSPGQFTPGVRAPRIHWIGGRMSSRVGLEAVLRRKDPSLSLPLTEFRSSSPYSSHYTD